MNSVHLMGSEDVLRAGHAIGSAAETIRSAANTIDQAATTFTQRVDLYHVLDRFDAIVTRFEAAVDRIPVPVPAVREERHGPARPDDWLPPEALEDGFRKVDGRIVHIDAARFGEGYTNRRVRWYHRLREWLARWVEE